MRSPKKEEINKFTVSVTRFQYKKTTVFMVEFEED